MIITMDYKKYEVFSALDLVKIKELIWEGVFCKTEVNGNDVRYFILITPNDFYRIKKNLPSIKIICIIEEL